MRKSLGSFCFKRSAALIGLVLIALISSACTYNAPPVKPQTVEIDSDFKEKIPGKFAIFIASEKMNGQVRIIGQACSGNKYVIDARDSFRTSTYKTVEKLVESLERVAAPLSNEEILARNLTGLIDVRVKALDIDMQVVTPMWGRVKLDSEAEIELRVKVEGPHGRLFSARIEGDERLKSHPGLLCERPAKVGGKVVRKAMKETLELLGERLSNAPELRPKT